MNDFFYQMYKKISCVFHDTIQHKAGIIEDIVLNLYLEFSLLIVNKE